MPLTLLWSFYPRKWLGTPGALLLPELGPRKNFWEGQVLYELFNLRLGKLIANHGPAGY